MRTACVLPAVLALVAGLWGNANAEGLAYRVSFSTSVVLALPADTGAEPAVYVRGQGEDWRPGEYTLEDGRIVMSLDPGTFKGGKALILINPPADMDIHDKTAPGLLDVAVDGVSRGAEPSVDLGASERWPRRVVVKLRDESNKLDPASAAVLLDGEPVAGVSAAPSTDARAMLLRARLGKVDYGDHRLSYSVADASPQQNRLTGTVSFGRYDMKNLALAAHGTKLTPDSCFSGYDDMAVLQDGVKPEAGSSLPGTVSWASAETPSPHWVEVEFAQPQTVKEVTVYWANYSHDPHTSRFFEVQIPEGDEWKTVYGSPDEGEKPATCTTAEFPPVTLSKLRVYQPGESGSESRPNLMWLTEIEVR